MICKIRLDGQDVRRAIAEYIKKKLADDTYVSQDGITFTAAYQVEKDVFRYDNPTYIYADFSND